MLSFIFAIFAPRWVMLACIRISGLCRPAILATLYDSFRGFFLVHGTHLDDISTICRAYAPDLTHAPGSRLRIVLSNYRCWHAKG
ncbi:MAG: hypothetical protein ACRD2P_00100 [Terriglobia bacterium]